MRTFFEWRRGKLLRTYLLLALSTTGILLSQQVSFASDWVEGNTNQFQMPTPVRSNSRAPMMEAPAPNLTPAQHPPPTVRQELGPELQETPMDPNLPPPISVMDPGARGAPSDQSAPRTHKLNGSASASARSWSQIQQQGGAELYRSPMPYYPDTKTVGQKVFQGWLTSTHPKLGLVKKDAIVEVKGQWDDSGHALHLFGLLATKVNPSRLPDFDLSRTNVIIVDCAGDLSSEALGAVRKFVSSGGYLITTDWSLDGCLARALPGFVTWNGGYSRSELVDARVVDPDPDLLKGAVQNAYWKLDNKCQTVKVEQPDRVDVLVVSKTLAKEDPNNDGVLAVTFNFGRGKALHLVGHFDSNTNGAFQNALPDPAPGIGISLRQAIAANFIVASLDHEPAPARQTQAATGSTKNTMHIAPARPGMTGQGDTTNGAAASQDEATSDSGGTSQTTTSGGEQQTSRPSNSEIAAEKKKAAAAAKKKRKEEEEENYAGEHF